MHMLLSMGLLSAMLLATQLVLIQALTFVQGHHLAYAILSIALLGFGAGGVLVTLLRGRSCDHLEAWYAPMASASGVAVAWLPRISRLFLVDLEVDLLFTRAAIWGRLAGLGVLLVVPFLLGAFALTVLFQTRSGKIGSYYAANLIGSALGALLVLPWLTIQLPEDILPWCGLLGIGAGLLAGRGWRWHVPSGFLVVAALLTSTTWMPSPYRDLAYALQLPEHAVSGPLPHYHGRVHIVRAPGLRYAPDVSLLYRGAVPAVPHYFVNGDRVAVQLDPAIAESRILLHTPQGLPYVLGAYERTLLLDPDGNTAVMPAAAVSDTVTVVMSHPLIAAAMQAVMPDGVSLVQKEPRAYLAGVRGLSYDLIVFPMRGMFGGPSGLQTLGEDPLFTVEGIQSAFAVLAESGWLAFPVWLDDPLRHSLRVLALIRAVLETAGVRDPAGHVLILRGWGSVLFMVSPAPVSPAVQTMAMQFAEAEGFDLLHPAPEDTAMRHGDPEGPPATFYRALLGSEPEVFLSSYRFDIRPPTDARPFFNQFMRPGDWASDLAWLSVSERGLMIIYVLLLQLAVAVLLLVLLPLLPLRRDMVGGWGTSGYFCGLGAGFMLFEVALIQLLIPLWGAPVRGAAFVITTLLLGMSLGSRFSGKLSLRWIVSGRLALLAGLALLLVGVSIPRIIHWVQPFGSGIRLVLLAVCLFLPAILLGMPFPGGIRYLRQAAPRQIPWACGIDGSLAVVAAPMAAILALHFGYPFVVLLGASAYAWSAFWASTGWKSVLAGTAQSEADL
ncbi:MAG: hypothetical protein ACNA71_01140 [Kiritimatiellia bacterium]